mmetsp:Transcript_39084/g.42332  ORF Transcript_39084/g.42332 Transcript_39084/m.42332 type:complete len:138 (-) Transcript_39084:13-426(-)
MFNFSLYCHNSLPFIHARIYSQLDNTIYYCFRLLQYHAHQGSITATVVVIDSLETPKEPPWHYQFRIDTISEQMLLVWINQNRHNKQHNPREQYLPPLRTSTSFMFWIVCFDTIREALMLPTLSLSIQQYYCKNHNI